MTFSPLELSLCAKWAKEHHGKDDPIDVYHWKLLEVGKEKAERSARFHARTVDDITTDLVNLSAEFYESEEDDPNGDETVDF